MSTLAMMEVQRALYAKLTADGVLMGMISGVYDAVPQTAALPYVVIGDGDAECTPELAAQVTQCQWTIEVWTNASGRKSALTILNRLHGLLHQGDITLTGLTLIGVTVTRAQTQVDTEKERVFGLLELRLMVRE